MFEIEFPLYLLLLFIIPFIYIIKPKSNYTEFPTLEFVKEKSSKVGMERLFLHIFVISLVLLIIALSNPVYTRVIVKKYGSGINTMIALDISGSMASEDYKPDNRLKVAKKVISDFIDSRGEDRIGLILFAGKVITKSPLSYAHGIIKDFLNSVNIGDIEDGTAIGMAIASAVNRLNRVEGETKTIILLTDGVNNKGEISPIDAALLAKKYGIKIYIVGVGVRGKALFPIKTGTGGKEYIKVDVKIDEPLMQKIVNLTGGEYFRAQNGRELEEIFKKIKNKEEGSHYLVREKRKTKLYPYLLFLSVIILFIFKIVDTVVFLEFP
jgi:Ca-activated chloride channel family protein